MENPLKWNLRGNFLSPSYLYSSNTMKSLQSVPPCEVRLKRVTLRDMSISTYNRKSVWSLPRSKVERH